MTGIFPFDAPMSVTTSEVVLVLISIRLVLFEKSPCRICNAANSPAR
jgi:hypothetical protein